MSGVTSFVRLRASCLPTGRDLLENIVSPGHCHARVSVRPARAPRHSRNRAPSDMIRPDDPSAAHGTITNAMAAEPAAASKAHRGPLAIALATSVTVVSGTTLVYPVLPVVATGFNVDVAHVGLVMAAFTAPAIFLAPLFGVLADLHGRRRVLLFGLALFAAAGSACSWAPSFQWLLGLRALQGVGMSALSPLTIALISDILPEHREIHGQGWKVALDRVANMFLPVIGGVLAAVSWRAPFVMYALIFLLALAALFKMPETMEKNSHTLKRYLAETLA